MLDYDEDLTELVESLICTGREDDWWDFKECYHEDRAALLHDIICLANNRADRDTYLILGVRDKTFEIMGVENDPQRRNQQNIVDFLSQKEFAGQIRPRVEVRTIRLEGHEVDVFIIKNSTDVPYYLIESYTDKKYKPDPPKKGKTVQAFHIYTRVMDNNTPIDKSADIRDVEYLWKKRFGLLQTPLEQVKILLRKPDEWAEEDSRYYHKLFPQYTISIEYEEDEDGISKEGHRVFYHHLQTDTRTQYGVLKIYHYSIGTLVQGKRGTPNYKIKQMKLRSKEDWCVVEKNHTPIISEELFTSVQHLLSLDTRTSPSEEVVQPLAGMLYCADCGRAMCRRSVKRGNRTFYYYVCSTHKRSKLCSSHSISQTALEQVVLRAIQKQIEMVVDIDQLIHEIGQKSIQAAKHRQLDMTIEEKEKQITEQKEYRMRLLEAFHDDLISRTEYDMMRQRYTQRIDALQAALASLHERRQALEEGAADTRNWVAEYTKFRKIDKLTREMVAGLIRRITVSEGKQITIQFNYADELASYQQMIAATAKEVG